jgi:hypothetical protein
MLRSAAWSRASRPSDKHRASPPKDAGWLHGWRNLLLTHCRCLWERLLCREVEGSLNVRERPLERMVPRARRLHAAGQMRGNGRTNLITTRRGVLANDDSGVVLCERKKACFVR